MQARALWHPFINESVTEFSIFAFNYIQKRLVNFIRTVRFWLLMDFIMYQWLFMLSVHITSSVDVFFLLICIVDVFKS